MAGRTIQPAIAIKALHPGPPHANAESWLKIWLIAMVSARRSKINPVQRTSGREFVVEVSLLLTKYAAPSVGVEGCIYGPSVELMIIKSVPGLGEMSRRVIAVVAGLSVLAHPRREEPRLQPSS
jgi:hypothetical protein